MEKNMKEEKPSYDEIMFDLKEAMKALEWLTHYVTDKQYLTVSQDKDFELREVLTRIRILKDIHR